MKIGVTFSETSFHNYQNWLQNNANFEIVELSFLTKNINDLADCEGIILTGGIDIKPKNTNYENAPAKFSEARDDFEYAVLAKAIEMKIPILGICRGLQLINYYFGGDLILDLGEKNHQHKKEEFDKIHTIEVVENSLLFQIVGQNIGEVNSAHHQSINNLANCLNISGMAADGVIEAVESKPDFYPFLLAVQWHPERLPNRHSPFSKNIKEAFFTQIKNNLK